MKKKSNKYECRLGMVCHDIRSFSVNIIFKRKFRIDELKDLFERVTDIIYEKYPKYFKYGRIMNGNGTNGISIDWIPEWRHYYSW